MKLAMSISKHMMIINDNGSSNPYDESNDNKIKLKNEQQK